MENWKRTAKRFAHTRGFTSTIFTDDGDKIITCGKSDGDVRIWKEVNDDDPASFCVGEAAIACAAVDDNKLIVSNDKNLVQYHDIPSGDRSGVVFRFSALVNTIKSNKIYLAAGAEDGTIKFVKRTSIDEIFELKGHEGTILHLDMNPNNHLLASSSGDGSIRVWDMKTLSCVKKFDGFEKSSDLNSAAYLSSPSFNPKGNLLAYPKGKCIHIVETTSWDEKFKLENNEIENDYSICSISACGMFLAAGTIRGEISLWSLASKSRLKGPYQGEDIDGICSIAWNPTNNGEFAFCDLDGQLSSIFMNDGDIDIDNADKEDVEMNNVDDLYEGINFQDDDADVDNENCISLERLKNETIKMNDDDDDDEDAKSMTSLGSQERIVYSKKFELQPAFQPGSTPGVEHRFMVWNHIGQVVLHAGDDNSIITEFHDVTLHPSLHILNNLNHEFASLSKSCLALATREPPSRLVCITFTGAGSKEWSMTMSDIEEIQAVAASDTFVAIATNLNFVRFYTVMGTQREVIAVPGQVVSMSANENKLIIAYHTSDTCNKFNMMIINIVGMKMTSKTIEIPSQNESKLAWIGFTDQGSPIVFDSTGKMYCYAIKRGIWIPICDMSDHALTSSDKYFIVSVSESQQKIRAVSCRGTPYPLTAPRPFATEIDFSLPLCNIETEKSKMEEIMVRSSIFNVDSSEKLIIENGLKLFSSALNSEFESRAFELIELLGERKLIELAAKYASQKGRIQMSNKINRLLSNFEELQREQQSLEENSVLEISEIQNSVIVPPVIQEASTPIIAPKPMATQRANPFKRSLNKGFNTPPSALGHLSKKVIGMNSTTKDSDDENTPKNDNSNSFSLISNKSLSADTPRPGNFMQWFIANKDDLKLTHPGVESEAELIKLGKIRYKEVTMKNKLQIDELNDSEQMSLSKTSSKRKLNVSDVAESGESKLSKFGYEQN